MSLESASAAENDGFVNPVVGRVQSMLSEARAGGENVGVLLVHAAAVDSIDALHGFNAGDRLSNKIVGLLRSKVLRQDDTIEMLSRDEFACILRPVSSESVAMLAAQRVMTLLGAAPLEFWGKGVENEAILNALAHLNCDHAQGYHVGKAVPGADLAARLREQVQSIWPQLSLCCPAARRSRDEQSDRTGRI